MLVLVPALAGCASGGERGSTAHCRSSSRTTTSARKASSARAPGRSAQCSRGTAYTIEDGDGEVVADGELPAGQAENADPSVDWGVERIPTVCVLELEVDLPERARYRFVLPDTLPIEFDAALLEEDEPLRLVLSG